MKKARILKFNGVHYLMRNQSPKSEILHAWQSFQEKYPGGKTTFDEWLNRGWVYLRLKDKQ